MVKVPAWSSPTISKNIHLPMILRLFFYNIYFAAEMLAHSKLLSYIMFTASCSLLNAKIVAKKHEACIQQLIAHCLQQNHAQQTAWRAWNESGTNTYTWNTQQKESICLVLQTWYPQTGTRIPIAKRIRHCFNQKQHSFIYIPFCKLLIAMFFN